MVAHLLDARTKVAIYIFILQYGVFPPICQVLSNTVASKPAGGLYIIQNAVPIPRVTDSQSLG